MRFLFADFGAMTPLTLAKETPPMNAKTIAITAVVAVLAVIAADYLGVTSTVRGFLPAKTP